MELVCKPSNFKSPIALVGAGTTSRDFYNSIKSTGAIVDLVVDSNPDLFGEYFYESHLQILELSSLTSFKGEIFIVVEVRGHTAKKVHEILSSSGFAPKSRITSAASLATDLHDCIYVRAARAD